jgi:glucose/arabinose dehydrogenase
VTGSPLPLALEQLGEFASPVWVGPAPGDPAHLYLALRSGTVLQLDPQGGRRGVLLDLKDQVSTGTEQGLLSIAFDPAYPRVPRLYVDFTDKDGNVRIVAYTVELGRAVRPQLLLTVPEPYENHNGGLILFDRTGMLLVGLGDGGNAGDPQNRAQDLQSLLGKILRIDPRTGGPAAGNPYPENRYVWALGLRNPWRFTFDAAGYLYVGCYEPSAILRLAPDGSVRTLVADPEAHALCHPTNLAFRGRMLLAANLGRWHISAVELDVEGLSLPSARRTAA